MKNDDWLNCSKRLRTLQNQPGAADHEPFVPEVIHFRPWDVGTSSAVSEGKEAMEEVTCRSCRWKHSSAAQQSSRKWTTKATRSYSEEMPQGRAGSARGKGSPGITSPVPTAPGRVCSRAQIVLGLPLHWFDRDVKRWKAQQSLLQATGARAQSWCISRTFHFIPSLPVKLDLSCSSSEDMSANCSSFWFSFFTVSRQVKLGKQSQ